VIRRGKNQKTVTMIERWRTAGSDQQRCSGAAQGRESFLDGSFEGSGALIRRRISLKKLEKICGWKGKELPRKKAAVQIVRPRRAAAALGKADVQEISVEVLR